MGQSPTEYCAMNNKGKFCLRLSEFESNVRESFRALREENKYFDVTLASDDGHKIEAHKVILAAGSKVLDAILNTIKHPYPYIYLKGIKREDIESIVSFLYTGEAYVEEECLDRFFEIAEELQVNGLQGTLLDKKVTIDEKVYEPKCRSIETIFTKTSNINSLESDFKELPVESEDMEDSMYTKDEDAPVLMSNEDLFKELPAESEDLKDSIHTKEEAPTVSMSNDELDLKIEQMMEKNIGMWICKMCGKISNKKFLIKEHIETHIDDVLHACPICSKISSTRKSLKVHIIDFHNEQSFSCTICDKEGMTKMAFKSHKKKCREDPILC